MPTIASDWRRSCRCCVSQATLEVEYSLKKLAFWKTKLGSKSKYYRKYDVCVCGWRICSANALSRKTWSELPSPILSSPNQTEMALESVIAKYLQFIVFDQLFKQRRFTCKTFKRIYQKCWKPPPPIRPQFNFNIIIYWLSLVVNIELQLFSWRKVCSIYWNYGIV